MIMSKNTCAVAAAAILFTSSLAIAQTGTVTGGGAEGTANSATGTSGDMKPGMKSDPSMMKKDGMMKKNGMMKKDGMKADDGMAADKKM